MAIDGSVKKILTIITCPLELLPEHCLFWLVAVAKCTKAGREGFVAPGKAIRSKKYGTEEKSSDPFSLPCISTW